jgi:hypothetical protein
MDEEREPAPEENNDNGYQHFDCSPFMRNPGFNRRVPDLTVPHFQKSTYLINLTKIFTTEYYNPHTQNAYPDVANCRHRKGDPEMG